MNAFNSPVVAALITAAIALASAARPPSTAPAANAQVTIDNFAFGPREITVARGTTVAWVNHDDVPHTVTSSADPPLFDSKALDTDERYSFTFTRSGTYPYYCKVHNHMRGVVIVK